MDLGVWIQLGMGVGSILFIGFTCYLAYRKGKSDEKAKQLKADVKALDENEEERTNVRPTSSDDRNSMRDGEF